MRIWWQSFADRAQNAPYFKLLPQYLHAIADPGTTVDVHGMSPPDRWLGRLAEFRCAAAAIANAIEAAAQGYDAFVFGHFQDSGLFEARSAVEIPVIGLGEAKLHWAAQLGRHLALVSIDPVFENWHREQAERYGLGSRVTHVGGLGLQVEDFAAAYAGDEAAYRRVLDSFTARAMPMVESGADVIVPAGGHPSLLLSREKALKVGHAPVVNSVAVALKCAEVAVKLRRHTGLEPSRGPSFALAPRGAVEDFLAVMRPPRG